MIAPENILRHELIGLEIEIVSSANKSHIGKKGVVVDETRNMLSIRESGKVSKLMKSAIVFRTKAGGKNIEVDGKMLIGRPEDRVKS